MKESQICCIMFTGTYVRPLKHYKSDLTILYHPQLKEPRVQQACAFNLGAAYVEVGKALKGLDILKRAQPGERGERVADLQFNLAVAHETLGNHSQVAGHCLQAAQLYRSQGDGASEGDTCMKMSHCHLLLKVSQLQVYVVYGSAQGSDYPAKNLNP